MKVPPADAACASVGNREKLGTGSRGVCIRCADFVVEKRKVIPAVVSLPFRPLCVATKVTGSPTVMQAVRAWKLIRQPCTPAVMMVTTSATDAAAIATGT
eukprot:SAG25_NODE_9969_length_350_cov_0.820717_1_plen_100_part_00